jgi:hypothetical protein
MEHISKYVDVVTKKITQKFKEERIKMESELIGKTFKHSETWGFKIVGVDGENYECVELESMPFKMPKDFVINCINDQILTEIKD